MSRVFQNPMKQVKNLDYENRLSYNKSMKESIQQCVVKTIQEFHLPLYNEIPDVGLYLDQTVKYINTFFKPLPNMELTTSMVSNYVKKGLIDRPIKKCYSRDQICYLMFIMIAKTVISMENIQLLFTVQKKVYDEETAYEYLRLELENILEYVFGLKGNMDTFGITESDEKEMLRNTIITFSHKIYLELCFKVVKGEQ